MGNPWSQHDRMKVYESPHLQLNSDTVSAPDGSRTTYDWVQAPDQVRVAAVVDGSLLLIEQYHYLLGQQTLQLPGGAVNPGEDALAAARRELEEETGFHNGTWTSYGHRWPLPSLTPIRSLLWLAVDLTPGTPHPDPSEKDLRVLRLPLAEACAAARDGRVGCAPSAALILSIPS